MVPGGKKWATVSPACRKRRLKRVATGRASGVKTLPNLSSLKLSYWIGRGPGQQRPLPVTGHQGLLMDMLLGGILVKREEVRNVGRKRKRGRIEERI